MRDTFEYDEFGNSLCKTYMNQPFGFTGYNADDLEMTGTLFAQARQYMPELGRFVSEDTHWHTENMIYGDNPHSTILEKKLPNLLAMNQANNLYGYTANNPFKYVDLIGNDAALAGDILKWGWGTGGGLALLDGPLPFGDIAGLVVGVGSTIVAGGILAWGLFSPSSDIVIENTLANTGVLTQREIEGLLEDFDNLECVEASQALAVALTQRGQSFMFAETLFEGYLGRSMIISDIDTRFGNAGGIAISHNNYHIGILINGIIHCNVHPQGLPSEAWFASFVGFGSQRRHIRTIPLGPNNPAWNLIPPTR